MIIAITSALSSDDSITSAPPIDAGVPPRWHLSVFEFDARGVGVDLQGVREDALAEIGYGPEVQAVN